jgi:plasmid maintenance system antidote protein VapI
MPLLRPNKQYKTVWPPNSIERLRREKGMKLIELAQLADANHQQIKRLEASQLQLDFDWAERIGKALGVEPEEVAYSNSPDAYPWATRMRTMRQQIAAYERALTIIVKGANADAARIAKNALRKVPATSSR